MSRPRSRSLSGHLTVGLVVLVAAACAAIGFASAIGLQRFLVARLDQQLVTIAGQQTALEASDPVVAPQLAGTLLVRIEDGRVTRHRVLVDADDEPQALTDHDLRTILATPAGEPGGVRFDQLGAYRILRSDTADGGGRVIGLPVHPITVVVERFGLIQAVGFLVVVAAAGLAGGVFVRRSLRPLREVTATADRVVTLQLATGDPALPDRVPEDGMQDEVRHVAAATNAMLTHVENALAIRQGSEERLRRFLADASHELRTPLAVIRSHAELARAELAVQPERALHSLGRVENEAVRLGGLVDDMLLLSRLDAGRGLVREPVDLSRLVAEAVVDAQVADPRRIWTLDLPERPVELDGDPARLHQVLLNLLANASQHTPDGTTVAVRVLDPRPGGTVTLEVVDDGPGVPPEHQPHLFERFTRADASRTRSSGGAGLGLAIASAVVVAHGGTISLDSRPGRTCFTVLLPAPSAS